MKSPQVASPASTSASVHTAQENLSSHSHGYSNPWSRDRSLLPFYQGNLHAPTSEPIDRAASVPAKSSTSVNQNKMHELHLSRLPSTRSISLASHLSTSAFSAIQQAQDPGPSVRPSSRSGIDLRSGHEELFQSLEPTPFLEAGKSTKRKNTLNPVVGLVSSLGKKFLRQIGGGPLHSPAVLANSPTFNGGGSKPISVIANPALSSKLGTSPSMPRKSSKPSLGRPAPLEPEYPVLVAGAGPMSPPVQRSARAPASEAPGELAGHTEVLPCTPFRLPTTTTTIPAMLDHQAGVPNLTLSTSSMRPPPTPKPGLNCIPEPEDNHQTSEEGAQIDSGAEEGEDAPFIQESEETSPPDSEVAYQLPALPPPISPFYELDLIRTRASRSSVFRESQRLQGPPADNNSSKEKSRAAASSNDGDEDTREPTSFKAENGGGPRGATTTWYISEEEDVLSGPGTNQPDEIDTPATHLSACSGLDGNTISSKESSEEWKLVTTARSQQFSGEISDGHRALRPRTALLPTDDITSKPLPERLASTVSAGERRYSEAVAPWEYQHISSMCSKPSHCGRNRIGSAKARGSSSSRKRAITLANSDDRHGSRSPAGRHQCQRKSEDQLQQAKKAELFLKLNNSSSLSTSAATSSSCQGHQPKQKGEGKFAKLSPNKSGLYRWSFSSPAITSTIPPTSTASYKASSDELHQQKQQNSPGPPVSGTGMVFQRKQARRKSLNLLGLGVSGNQQVLSGLWKSQPDVLDLKTANPTLNTNHQTSSSHYPTNRIITRSHSSANLLNSTTNLSESTRSSTVGGRRAASLNHAVSPTADPATPVGAALGAKSATVGVGEGSKISGSRPGLKGDSGVKLKLLPREENETEMSYLVRLEDTIEKSMVVSALGASSDPFHASAMVTYLNSFEFAHDPIDIALRKLLLAVSLPKETQQIDRVMEAFAKRYVACNPKLYASSDQVYVLAFSIIMLHTDAFNKHNRAKMSRADYVKNTRMDGIPNEVLEYIYDNVTYTQFIFVDEDRDITGTKLEYSTDTNATGSFFHLGSSSSSNHHQQPYPLRGEKAKIDPYALIARGLTHELRPDIESVIPSRNPFSFTGSVPYFDSARLRRSFGGAVTIQMVNVGSNGLVGSTGSSGKGSRLTGELTWEQQQQIGSAPSFDQTHEQIQQLNGSVMLMTNLKAVKVGLAYKKDEGDGRMLRNVTKKWKEWCVVLTGSQLMFMRDTTLVEELQQSFEEASRRNKCPDQHAQLDLEDQDQLVVRITGLKPDTVFSLENGIALMDVTYTRRPNTFRLVLAKEHHQEYLMEVPSEVEMNSWITHINYAAAFKSTRIPFRSSRETFERIPNGFGRSSSSLAEIIKPRVSTSSSALSRSGYEEHLASVNRDRAPSFGWGPVTGESVESEDGARRVNGNRSELVRRQIESLEQEIFKAKTALNEDLRIARNLAVLTPLMVSTKARLQASIVKIAARVREARFGLSKLVCYREILLRDHLLDKTSLATNKEAAGVETASALDQNQLTASASGMSAPLSSSEVAKNVMRDVEVGHRQRDRQESITRPPRREYRSNSSSQVRMGPLVETLLASRQGELMLDLGTQLSQTAKFSDSDHRPPAGPSISQLILEAELHPAEPRQSTSSAGAYIRHHHSSSMTTSKSPIKASGRSPTTRPSTANTFNSTSPDARSLGGSSNYTQKRFTRAWGLP